MKWKRNDLVITEPIVDYLIKTFDEELAKGYTLKVSVGTDSQKSGGSGQYKFATVILITTTEDLGGIIVGRGGIIIATTYYNTFKKRNKELVNERMVYEVGKSVEVAYEIAELLDVYDIKLEIHADINPDLNGSLTKLYKLLLVIFLVWVIVSRLNQKLGRHQQLPIKSVNYLL